ncbi:SRPBCC domain-containing protein [Streptomyces triticirhizae]|uniref:Polyketide cyclase / dehydrase and lipid transport family protein n=1 Tax=Streptomyces triticirhizae TaxID=2483353 RepID=A0A3M2LLX9_9ACTN|nr:SRPBCC domain-containing protein [Streptomyces triticirhizae]RMI37533.1 polyketide cyclase / dehydrase and lipid transport family protein [Streptomyces triticirhizae]
MTATDDRPPAGAGLLGLDEHGVFGIRFDRPLRHSPTEVWRALTDPDRLSFWLPGCLIEPWVGGRVRFNFGEEGAATGVVRSLHAPETPRDGGALEHSWRWDGLPESVVAWRLTPAPQGTRLLLTHREPPRDAAGDFALGWHLILDVLTRHLDGASSDEVWAQAASLAAHYAAG